MRKTIMLAAAAGLSMLLAGCNTSEDRAVNGALLGGTAGALIGGLGSNSIEGALVGGAIGAVGGAVIGQATTPSPRYRCVRVNRYNECVRQVRVR